MPGSLDPVGPPFGPTPEVVAPFGAARTAVLPLGGPIESQHHVGVGDDLGDRNGLLRAVVDLEGVTAQGWPFLTASTRLRKPSVAVPIRPLAPFLIKNPGSGTRGSMVRSKRTRVKSPSEV